MVRLKRVSHNAMIDVILVRPLLTLHVFLIGSTIGIPRRPITVYFPIQLNKSQIGFKRPREISQVSPSLPLPVFLSLLANSPMQITSTFN